jgi:hypothetical protein
MGHVGRLEAWFPAVGINCYVARTAKSESRDAPPRAKQDDFHIFYALATLPVGADLMTRIEMMASDATRNLKRRKLTECLDQLYSKATDVLGLALAMAASDALPSAPGQQKPAQSPSVIRRNDLGQAERFAAATRAAQASGKRGRSRAPS